MTVLFYEREKYKKYLNFLYKKASNYSNCIINSGDTLKTKRFYMRYQYG